MLSQLLGFLLLLLLWTPVAVVADLASIRNALDVINDGLRRVDLATIGLPATASALAALEAIAVPLVENATAVITASTPLGFEDSQNLVVATQALRSNLNISINDFIAQKPLLDASGQSASLLASLAAEGNVTLKMASALLSKLDPQATQAQASLTQVREVLYVILVKGSGGLLEAWLCSDCSIEKKLTCD